MHEIQLNVRFCETDALGHINNTSYFIYLEDARVRFFETLGYSMDTKKWNFIIASTHLDFVSQGYFNQLLTVKTYVSRIGNKSFQLDHQIICSQTGQLIAKGNCVTVFYNFNTQTSERLPDSLREHLKSYLVHS